MILTFVLDGADVENEREKQFELSVEEEPVMRSQEDSVLYVPNILCPEDRILIQASCCHTFLPKNAWKYVLF